MRRVREERDRFVGFVLDAVDNWPARHKLRGRARFIAPHLLRVDDQCEVHAKRIVIATGSSAVLPPGWRERLGERLIVNDDVFSWQDLPRSVAITGGGVISPALATSCASSVGSTPLTSRSGRRSRTTSSSDIVGMSRNGWTDFVDDSSPESGAAVM